MIDHGKQFQDACRRRHCRQNRPADHHHLDTKRSCRGDLAVGRLATAVLGNDDVDTVLDQQTTLIRLVEGPASQQIVDMGNAERRLDRVDAAQEIVVLGSRFENTNVLAPKRQENTPSGATERNGSICSIVHFRPAVTLLPFPAGAAQSQDRHTGKPRGFGGIVGNARRIGMRRIDQKIGLYTLQVGCKAFGAAEAADPRRHLLGNRVFRAPCQRKGQVDVGSCRQPTGQLPGLYGSAQDENAVGHHAC